MSHPLFIVFEGIDGCGKSTQLKNLVTALQQRGRSVFATAEPTSTPTGKMLRAALSGTDPRTPAEMAALFTLDRIHHNKGKGGIDEALAAGMDVISDRYYYSSLAYQGSLTSYEWVRGMNCDCPEIRKPDLCIFLDLAPDKCLERISQNRLVTEIYEEKTRLERYRKRYFEIFEMLKFTDNIAVIDTDKAVEEIAEEVYSKVSKLNVE